LRKLIPLLILLLFGVAGVYYTGALTEISVGNLINRLPVEDPGQELNAMGIAELNAGKPAAAAAVLRQASRLEPENRIIARNLSIALAREAGNMSGDEQAAIQLLEESLKLWPKNPEGLDGLSSIHFRAARYKDALDYAMVLKEMMPERTDLAEYVKNIQKRVADEKGMSFETGDRFRLLYSEEKRLEYVGEIVAILQTQLDSLTVALGIFPDKPIDVLLLTEDLGTRADPLDPFLEGLYDGQIRLYLGEGIADRKKLILTVRHEMVHALLHQAAGNLPGWVQEGLAQKAGEEPAEDHLAAVRKYVAREIKEGYRVDLAAMGISFINMESEKRTRAYATSLLFMDYLSRKYGNGFIPRFVAEIAFGVPPRDVLKTLTGSNFTQLQVSFSEDLEKEYK